MSDFHGAVIQAQKARSIVALSSAGISVEKAVSRISGVREGCVADFPVEIWGHNTN